MRKSLLLLSTLLVGSLSLSAQSQQVSGTVKGSDGNPVSGVTVVLEGTNTATFSDGEGRFTIAAPADGVLSLSLIGMESQQVAVGGRNVIEIEMAADAKMIDDVIVVAYGTARKSSFTGAASKVSAGEMKHAAVETADKMLAGRVSGIRVGSASGSPGSGGEVQIRGIGSINGSTAPLYVVDGVPINSANLNYRGQQSMLTTINPADIETMTVLKDAAAASLYGSRAANGVIIITTKKGRSGRAKVNFSASVGVQSMAVKDAWNFMSGTEFYDYFLTALDNNLKDGGSLNGKAYNMSNEEYLAARGITRRDGEDWKKYFFRTGIDQNYDVSVSGGSDVTNYYVGMSYQDVNGIVQNSAMKRYSFIANTSTRVTDWFSLDGKAQVSYAKVNNAGDNSAAGNGWSSSSASSLMASANPTDFAYDANGNVNPNSALGRPVPAYEVGEEYIFMKSNTARALVNAAAEVRFTDKLKFRSTNGVDFSDVIFHEYWNPNTVNGSSIKGLASNTINRMINVTSSNILQYGNTFGSKHNVDALAGYEVTTYDSDATGASVNNLSTDNLYALSTGRQSSVSGSYGRTLMTSVLSNANYNFDNRYYASASVRADKSSQLGADKRTGVFWSVSGSWRVSGEGFMQNSRAITNLRLKASYGTNGNLPGAPYGRLSSYTVTGQYGENSAFYPVRPENRDLGWERSNNLNVGAELTLFQRFEFNVEYFNKNTHDLLMYVPGSAGTGFTTRLRNNGSIRNSGVEFEFHGNNVLNTPSQGVHWGTDVLLSTLRAKVVSLPGGNAVTPGDAADMYRYAEGQDLYGMFLRQWYGVDPANGDGLFRINPNQDVDYKAYAADPTKGNLTNDYDKANRGYVGKGYPDLAGSWNNTLTWKGFTLGALVTYQFGGTVYNYLNYFMESGGRRAWSGTNQNHSVVGNYWTKPGDNVSQPRPTTAATGWDLPSSRWTYSSDYFRLKQLSLAYALPEDAVGKIGMSNMTLTLSAYNVAYIWKAAKGMDPETNMKGFLSPDVPLARTITLGVTIGF